MHERADRLARRLVAVEDDLDAEFEQRLVESSTLAFRIAFGVLHQRQDAEDVAQEAIAKAYRNFRQLRDRTRFRAWLVRMTWRLAIDRQTADRRRLQRESDHAMAMRPPHVSSDAARAEQLRHAIDALPRKLRIVTVLAAIQGYDIKEVALLLGLPPGTVKSRLFLARRRLKEILQ